MAVMEMKFVRRPRVEKLDRSIELAIVIASHDNDFTGLADLFEKFARFEPSRAVMDEVAKDDQSLWAIIREQFQQSAGD